MSFSQSFITLGPPDPGVTAPSPLSRVAGGVTETCRVVAAPSPRAGWLAESRRHTEWLRRPAPEQGGSRRCTEWLRRPAPEQGGWRSCGDTPSSCGIRIICIFTVGLGRNGQKITVGGPLLAEYSLGNFWKVDSNSVRSSGLPLHTHPILFKRGRARPAEGYPFPCLLASLPPVAPIAFPQI